MPVWFLAIIPLAVIFLWLFFRVNQSHKRQQSTLSSEYFKGLNYLLNDEQGKALDIFVKLVESNWDTIDTHFALGKIYRKNGEMDKAIKIHQGLIARPSLPDRYRSKILLELGYDYLGAGWFDRAEGLFKEVLIEDPESREARHNLILIYQQEKDWYKAIEIADELYREDPAAIGPMIAHYYCELAEVSRTRGDVGQLENNARKALGYDANCVRATILLADRARGEGDYAGAVRLYENIEKQDAESIILVIDSLLQCYQQLGQEDRLYDYLLGLQQRHENLYLQNVIASVLEKSKGEKAAMAYLSERIRQHPSLEGVLKLITYKAQEIEGDEVFNDLVAAITLLQKDAVEYRCQKCGFSTNTHYWLCPSCNHWGTVKPGIMHPGHGIIEKSEAD